MVKYGEHTISEIMSQPTIWLDALAAFDSQSQALIDFWKEQQFEEIILTGCGSTYYLADVGARLLQEQTGIPAQAYPASELMIFPETTIPSTNAFLITVSRSGETRETIEAARLFRERNGGKTAVIGCTTESTLVKETDFSVIVDSAQEKSIAQTKSFASMTILLEALAGTLAGKDAKTILSPLPKIVERLLDEYYGIAQKLGENTNIKQIAFLGSGVLYGLACEAMLKMTEMSLVPSTAFHILEFMHGPKYVVNDEQTLIVALISEVAAEEEISALRKIKERGGQILVIAENDMDTDIDEWCHLVRLQSGLPLWARAILYLPVLQLLAYYQGVSRGKNPDRPL
jgi:glutamine---fructose-6-phosphate transaminase (isomerizing)